MRDNLTETYVRSVLGQAGCSEDDIRAFLDDDATLTLNVALGAVNLPRTAPPLPAGTR